MSTITLNADSTTLILNGRIIDDLIEGDNIEIAPVNPLTSRINGSNGGVNIQDRADAHVCDLTVRVQAKSDSDIFFNEIINSKGVTIVDGSAKESFTRDGSASIESWILSDGSMTDQPTHGKNNLDGSAVVEYKFQFRTGVRNI